MAGTTLVTGLFDLARREPVNGRRTPEEYLRAGEWVLGLDEDLVVFADPEWAGRVMARRRALGRADRTTVVPLALEDTEAHTFLDAISRARERHPLQASPTKDTPLYTVCMWAKLELLSRARRLAVDGTADLAWIDFALAARPSEQDAGRVFAGGTARCVVHVMRGFDARDFADADRYFERLYGHVAGGFIVTPPNLTDELAARFGEVARCALAAGFAGSDEQLLPLLCLAAPDLFEFRYGDYGSLLLNHLQLRGDAENLRCQLCDARRREDWPHGARLCRLIVAGLRDGTFSGRGGELAELLDECFLAAWYGLDDGRRMAAEVAQLYAGSVRRDAEFREVFLREEIRTRSNFELLTGRSRHRGTWPW